MKKLSFLDRELWDRKISTCIVFELIGVPMFIMLIVLGYTTQNFKMLLGSLVPLVFIIEGIRYPFFEDKQNKKRILYGYRGAALAPWSFGYCFFVLGLAMLTSDAPIAIVIIGVLFIMFSLYCWSAKLFYYIKYKTRDR